MGGFTGGFIGGFKGLLSRGAVSYPVPGVPVSWPVSCPVSCLVSCAVRANLLLRLVRYPVTYLPLKVVDRELPYLGMGYPNHAC